MLIKDDKKIRQGVSPNPAFYICISIFIYFIVVLRISYIRNTLNLSFNYLVIDIIWQNIAKRFYHFPYTLGNSFSFLRII